MEYVGMTGKVYTAIEPEINKGGEGKIYAVYGEKDYLMKIFHKDKRTLEKHKKVQAMVNTKLTSEMYNQLSWPIDMLFESGSFAGYVMRKIENCKNLNLYNTDLYEVSLEARIVICKNLCAAINSVHELGYVCGDLNPENILANEKDCSVVLVDTDSFFIKDGSEEYECKVGIKSYWPYEVHKRLEECKDLNHLDFSIFSIYTDYFSLAIHIFTLLMNGAYPFACAIDPKSSCSIKTMEDFDNLYVPKDEDNIIDGFFPSVDKREGLTIPRYCPKFDYLPIQVQELFIKAFVEGHKDGKKRPTPIQWYKALEYMRNHITKTCPVCGKQYTDTAKECPWCEMDKRRLENKTCNICQESLEGQIHSTVSKQASQASNNVIKPQLNNSPQTPCPQKTQNQTTADAPLFSKAGIFWITTIAINTVFSLIIFFLWDLFDTDANPIFFIIAGFIGSIIYNVVASFLKNSGEYKLYNYILSIICFAAGLLIWGLVRLLFVSIMNISFSFIVGASLILALMWGLASAASG